MQALCISVKSKKDTNTQCDRPATKGTFCSIHHRCKNKIVWVKPLTMLTRAQKTYGKKVLTFLQKVTALNLIRRHGLAYFIPKESNNDTDIYTLDSVSTIPHTYRFSYVDSHNNLWLFDSRFLMVSMQYERSVLNPFTQEEIPSHALNRLQLQSDFLQKHSLPMVYVTEDTLTPEQRWNQKVLDVFLRIRIHGYGVNVIWFESLTITRHINFYTRLYDLWNNELHLTEQDKERIVPDHKKLIFSIHPDKVMYHSHTLKWWMKHNLSLMHTLVSASPEKGNRGCGALYILTALARVNPDVAVIYPWL